jgi:hypothetical protein
MVVFLAACSSLKASLKHNANGSTKAAVLVFSSRSSQQFFKRSEMAYVGVRNLSGFQYAQDLKRFHPPTSTMKQL